MERNGMGCGDFRLTPSDTKFGRSENRGYWVLGDIFLQNYYSIYDFPNKQMGLIESKDFQDSLPGESPAPNSAAQTDQKSDEKKELQGFRNAANDLDSSSLHVSVDEIIDSNNLQLGGLHSL